MDIEKAKERIKSRLDYLALDNEDLEALQTLIPELAESKDERIRKEIYDFISNYVSGFVEPKRAEWLAWIEKQKEEISAKPEALKKAYEKGKVDALKEHEGEEWIAPEDYTVAIDNVYQKGIIDTLSNKDEKIKEELLHAYNEGQRDLLKEMKTAEWSNEDMDMIGSIRSTIELDIQRDANCPDIVNMHKKELEWFDSLYDRGLQVEQKPTEWKEDENILHDCIKCVERGTNNMDQEYGIISWLKSLKNAQTWKPSKEQIQILKMVLTDEAMDDNVHSILESLYDDLKKL